MNHGEHGGRGEKILFALSESIIGAAIQVHRALGPGLLESAYSRCLAYELDSLGHSVEIEKAIPLRYRKQQIDCGFRMDSLVNSKVIVELKAVEQLLPIHEAQLLTYLRLSGRRLGLLLNFNVRALKDGLKRFVL